MAPFQSPNYTQTPNDLFDELLPIMGLAELKVVLCVVRHTFGYHADEAKLSIRRIARMTGLSPKSVMDGSRQAEEHGLIELYTDGNKTTIWKASVSVLPSNTRRVTKVHASVLPTPPLSAVKERKKQSKENNDDDSAAAIKEKTSVLSTLYESNIGAITSLMADFIRNAAITYPQAWFEPAFEIAVKNNVRKWGYVEAVLEGWKLNGFGWSPPHNGNGHGKKTKKEYPAPPEVSDEEAERLRALAREAFGK